MNETGGGRRACSALEHMDSMGNQEVLSRGRVQFTSAGTGIRHSEYNADKLEGGVPVRFLQIWAAPDRRGLRPAYQTGTFSDASKRDSMCPILVPAAKAVGTGAGGSATASGAARADGEPLFINNALRMYASLLGAGATLTHDLAGRRAYLHVPIMPGSAGLALRAAGAGTDCVRLAPGDGAFVDGVDMLEMEGLGAPGGGGARVETEFVLLDMPRA